MTEYAPFHKQAQSDLAVFELLRAEDREVAPECHALHHLQMATEKLAKAILGALTGQPVRHSHETFSRLEQHLRRRDVARVLGYEDYRAYRASLRAVNRLARRIDLLHPQVGTGPSGRVSEGGPNVEYPWEARGPDGRPTWHVPAQHDFGLLRLLRQVPDGRKLIRFIQLLSDRFNALVKLGR